MTLPGGITSVYSFIDVDNETEIKGSFNTTYVYTYDYVTLFQSYFFGNLAIFPTRLLRTTGRGPDHDSRLLHVGGPDSSRSPLSSWFLRIPRVQHYYH